MPPGGKPGQCGRAVDSPVQCLVRPKPLATASGTHETRLGTGQRNRGPEVAAPHSLRGVRPLAANESPEHDDERTGTDDARCHGGRRYGSASRESSSRREASRRLAAAFWREAKVGAESSPVKPLRCRPNGPALTGWQQRRPTSDPVQRVCRQAATKVNRSELLTVRFNALLASRSNKTRTPRSANAAPRPTGAACSLRFDSEALAERERETDAPKLAAEPRLEGPLGERCSGDSATLRATECTGRDARTNTPAVCSDRRVRSEEPNLTDRNGEPSWLTDRH